MKIRSDTLSLQHESNTHSKASQAKKVRGFSRKAVFHRKKVVQLSLNNHCHAILKTVFCFSLDYDSCGLVFPPFLFFHQNDVWESTVSGRRKTENTKCWCAPSSPFFSFTFSFILLNHGKYIQLLRFSPTCCSLRQFILTTKLFSLLPYDTLTSKKPSSMLINFMNR